MNTAHKQKGTEYMETIILKVPDMSCSHCEHAIKNAVGNLNGVHNVIVNLKDKTVKVSFNQTEVTIDSIKTAIEGEGYSIA
jgi:copper chaperone